MKEFLITILPLLTAFFGWIANWGANKYKSRTQKYNALAEQDRIIQGLYLRLAQSNENVEKKIQTLKEVTTKKFEKEISNIKIKYDEQIEIMKQIINKMKSDCDCPDEE